MTFRHRLLAFFAALLVVVSLSTSNYGEDAPQQSGATEEVNHADGSAIARVSHEEKEGTVSDDSNWTLRDIAYLLAPFLSLGGVGLIVYFTRINTISEQWLKINTSEAQYIQDKLDKFYGPFILESQANHLMAQDLRSRQPQPTMHRLLDKLFDEDWRSSLPAGDSVLVEEICNTGERLSGVIKDHSGLVDPLLLPYIARAITHFRILKLAHEKKLGTDSTPFLRYVYPKNLDAALEKELSRLQHRLQLLRQNPTVSHADQSPLDLSNCPLDAWPDNPRPDFDSNTGELTPPTDSGGSLIRPPGAATKGLKENDG